jgi:ankyrin repeat protein
LEAIKTLIKSGADVNIQDTNGWTVLHHAASLGEKNVIE